MASISWRHRPAFSRDTLPSHSRTRDCVCPWALGFPSATQPCTLGPELQRQNALDHPGAVSETWSAHPSNRRCGFPFRALPRRRAVDHLSGMLATHESSNDDTNMSNIPASPMELGTITLTPTPPFTRGHLVLSGINLAFDKNITSWDSRREPGFNYNQVRIPREQGFPV